MYCSKCGAKIKNESKYCSNCGTNILGDNQNQTIVRKQNNDTAPLILSIIALLTFMIPLISIPCAIISLIKSNKISTESRKACLILDIISIILSVLFVLTIFIFIIFAVDTTEENKSGYNNHQYNYNYDEYDKDNDFDIFGNDDIDNKIWYSDDDQTLNLEDKTYEWYIDDNNYQKGKYESYNGIEALNYIDSKLEDYSISIPDQWKNFTDKTELENYYLLILNMEELTTNGITTRKEEQILYYGFYNEDDDTLSLTNIKDNSKIEFKSNSINHNKDNKDENRGEL